MTKVMIAFCVFLTGCGYSIGTDQTRASFTMIVFNYWCLEGRPPNDSRELSSVVDLEELDDFLDFNPDRWLKLAEFIEVENKKAISVRYKESFGWKSKTSNTEKSTYECEQSQQT